MKRCEWATKETIYSRAHRCEREARVSKPIPSCVGHVNEFERTGRLRKWKK